MSKINLLDGGMIFELNKFYNDYGQKAVSENNELIKSIYQMVYNMFYRYFAPHSKAVY